MNCDITRMTFAVRIKREFLQLEKGLGMAIELKGLRGKASLAATNIDRLNTAYNAFNEAAPAHAADVESLIPQISGLHDDLVFAAQVLGNSVAGSNANTGGVDNPEPGKVERASGLATDEQQTQICSNCGNSDLIPVSEFSVACASCGTIEEQTK